MSTKQSVWRDVIVAMLSPYNIQLEKVDNMDFGAQGLCDPSNLVRMSHEEINNALCNAGYDRGNLNGIFIPRLQALASYVQNYDKAKLEKILAGTDISAIKQSLLPIKGVGPKVVQTYLLLRGLNEDAA